MRELYPYLDALLIKGEIGKERLAFVITSISENKVLEKIKKQDMSAVIDWFTTRQSKFYKLGWSYLKNHQDVEDVFHNTIMKVHAKIGQLKEDRSFESWVTSIFINECRAIYRKRKPSEMEFSQDMGAASHFQDELEMLDDLDRLDEKYREMIMLRYFQGYSQKEIATIFKLPVGTVKSRIYRGLLMLRKIIEGGDGDEV
ncbi:RNA polymerase sigma factor [Peribacillus sp. NPDC097197]|uniref:RNA polymerase sigma factor n=1 Tax=Peribacillus sp. NPDC097197 TaxID=3390615 RepID=UPI003D050012